MRPKSIPPFTGVYQGFVDAPRGIFVMRSDFLPSMPLPVYISPAIPKKTPETSHQINTVRHVIAPHTLHVGLFTGSLPIR